MSIHWQTGRLWRQNSAVSASTSRGQLTLTSLFRVHINCTFRRSTKICACKHSACDFDSYSTKSNKGVTHMHLYIARGAVLITVSVCTFVFAPSCVIICKLLPVPAYTILIWLLWGLESICTHLQSSSLMAAAQHIKQSSPAPPRNSCKVIQAVFWSLLHCDKHDESARRWPFQDLH